MSPPRPTRRDVLLAGGALLVAVSLPAVAGAAPEPASGSDTEIPRPQTLNPFLAVTLDDEVIVWSPSSEMGQGIGTTLAMIVAEELDADWSRVRFEHAPAARVYRRRVGPGIRQQLTGGSTSTALWNDPLRQAGAEARAMLVAAAAERFGVKPEDCTVRQGIISAGDQRVRFGDVAWEASQQSGRGARPKDPADYRLRGTDAPRLDLRAKVTGAAVFGADVRVPDMLFAAPMACPVFGGRVGSVDDTAARAVKGVVDVAVFEDWVAVVADSTWAAMKGLRALDVSWEEGAFAGTSSADIDRARDEALGDPRQLKTLKRHGSMPDLDGDDVVRATYRAPYLDHLTMEPIVATAHVTDTDCFLWIPTQAQTLVERAARKRTGLSRDHVHIHTTFLGGGFGRRGYTDEALQAIELSLRTGRPVQVQWSREESVRHGYYRPAATAHLAGKLGADGAIAGLHAKLAAQSPMEGFLPGFLLDTKLTGRLTAEGMHPVAYTLGAHRLELARVDTPIPVGFWRSVGHSTSAFFMESFVDELAHAAGEDPKRFRLDRLPPDSRHHRVLSRAVREAGDPPPGRHHGVAVHEAYGSVCAEVVEISVDERGWPIVHRIVAVVDCGEVVHPDGARAQLMSGALFALAATLYGEITVEDGRVVQSNFHDARIARMHESPPVEAFFEPTPGAPPTGTGELATPPLAPALYNAIFAATGVRHRTLPLARSLEDA